MTDMKQKCEVQGCEPSGAHGLRRETECPDELMRFQYPDQLLLREPWRIHKS